MSTVSSAIRGIDGGVPVHDPEGLWKIWALWEIWRGQEGKNRFVPNVHDWVTDPTTREMWIVDHLDPVSLIPTLRPFTMVASSSTFTENDLIMGKGPGAPSDIFKVYINNEVMPHSAAVDAGCFIYGTLSSYVKVFAGTDTHEDTGRVVSKTYDASGNFVSTSVPLELVAIDSHTNYSIKTVRRFSVAEEFQNGDILTVVVYADDNHVVYKRSLIVENTNTIIDNTQGIRYIENISIESIWLNNTVPNQLDYPLNIPMNSLNMIGVVHYSDGTKLRLPIGGEGKFAMLGLNGHVSSIPGQPLDLTLRYTLDRSEIAFASGGTNNRYITKPYRLITTNPNFSLQVKLFCYPEWVSSAVGYRVRWYLLSAERNIFFDVTNNVSFASNTGPFNPKLYGYLQRKTVSINLRDVSPAFPPWNHVQNVDIVLMSPPSSDNQPSWTVLSEASDTVPRFGTNTFARIATGNKVNLGSLHTTLDEWLDDFYRKTLPLVRINQEAEAPDPTHFVTRFNGIDVEYPISNWKTDIMLGAAVSSGKLLTLKFVRKTTNGDMVLSVAGVITKQF